MLPSKPHIVEATNASGGRPTERVFELSDGSFFGHPAIYEGDKLSITGRMLFKTEQFNNGSNMCGYIAMALADIFGTPDMVNGQTNAAAERLPEDSQYSAFDSENIGHFLLNGHVVLASQTLNPDMIGLIYGVTENDEFEVYRLDAHGSQKRIVKETWPRSTFCRPYAAIQIRKT